MSRLYTKQEILQKCESAFNNIPKFYDADIINYSSHIKESNLPCTEIIAEFLCERIHAFISGFQTITRESSYHTKSHHGDFHPDSPRTEENLAKQLFSQSEFDDMGKILDYQIPLKNVNADSAGKIDLLSVNHSLQTVYVLELKKPDSNETMLRCVLEAYTYLRTVDHAKLLKDFGLPEQYVLNASPLIFRNGVQQKEMHQNRPALKKLMLLLNSQPYYLDQQNETYIISP